MITMSQLFPGVTGKLTLARVMIRLRRPDLKDIPPNEPLPPELEATLKIALKEVRRA